jgi:hypothetical protein
VKVVVAKRSKVMASLSLVPIGNSHMQHKLVATNVDAIVIVIVAIISPILNPLASTFANLYDFLEMNIIKKTLLASTNVIATSSTNPSPRPIAIRPMTMG